ncbi:MAG: hypothetical protein ACYDDO_02940 [Acidiferrobacterales bacterium]
MVKVGFHAIALFLPLMLSACGSGSSPIPPNPHTVSLSWSPNDESGVNSPGGGYQILVNGTVAANVPYTAGALAPTSTTISLTSGMYMVTVRAYAALDAQGGASGTYSAASQPITVTIPLGNVPPP